MKLRTLSIFATALVVSLAACGGGDEPAAEGTDTTTVSADTGLLPPPAPVTPDTLVPPAGTDTTAPTDSTAAGTDTAADTTK